MCWNLQNKICSWQTEEQNVLPLQKVRMQKIAICNWLIANTAILDLIILKLKQYVLLFLLYLKCKLSSSKEHDT